VLLGQFGFVGVVYGMAIVLGIILFILVVAMLAGLPSGRKIQSCEKFFNQVPISIGFPVRGYFCLGHVISGLLSQFQYISMWFFLMEVAWKTDQRFFKLARLWPSGPSFMG